MLRARATLCVGGAPMTSPRRGGVGGVVGRRVTYDDDDMKGWGGPFPR